MKVLINKQKIEQKTFNVFNVGRVAFFCSCVAILGSTYLLDKTIYIVYISDISIRTLLAPAHASDFCKFCLYGFLPCELNTTHRYKYIIEKKERIRRHYTSSGF